MAKLKPIQIAHEAPVQAMKKVSLVTDYEYALVAEFEKTAGYYDHFVEAKEKGRTVLLDNSVFEEGVPFNPEAYSDWILKLEPDEYIIPDVLEDCEQTIENAKNWLKEYRRLPGKKIGVVQGKTLTELIDCYKFMAGYCDKIAISFDLSFYEEMYNEWLVAPVKRLQHTIFDSDQTIKEVKDARLLCWMYGRMWLLNHLKSNNILVDKPHHLLGCSLPAEFTKYKDINDYFNIESLDTSNPVVWALKKGIYPPLVELITTKDSTLLKDLLQKDIDDDMMDVIITNIYYFRQWVK